MCRMSRRQASMPFISPTCLSARLNIVSADPETTAAKKPHNCVVRLADCSSLILRLTA